MKLPNADLAVVPERKVTHYLLNPGHPAGGSKAAFFIGFGYTAAEWQRLAASLLRLAHENEVVEMEQTRTAALRGGRAHRCPGWHALEHPHRLVY